MTGNLLIGAGVLLMVAGLALKTGLFSWFGHLPGDIRYEGEHFVFYAPLGSMLLISAVISLLLWLFNR
jgi:energy-converting hydrogenase Eha subunit H